MLADFPTLRLTKFGTQNRKFRPNSSEGLLEPSLKEWSESGLLLCAFSICELKMNRFLHLWCMCKADTAHDRRPKPAV